MTEGSFRVKIRRECGMETSIKCKIVVVGDARCGKSALLHVFAKDCFPEVSAREGGLYHS